jgi:hypothetical protein
VAVILTAVDFHLQTNRFIAKVDRMCDERPGVSDGDYRRKWEEEKLIFAERIRRTYRPRDGN